MFSETSTYKLIIFLILFNLHQLYSQDFTSDDLKVFSDKLNTEVQGYIDPSTNVKGRGVTSIGKLLVFQYNVPSDWFPYKNLKEKLIQNLVNSDNDNFYIVNKIDLSYFYYKKNVLIKRVRINWEELNNSKISLDEFIELTNHPKSNRIEYKLKPPIGWEVIEGDRPHIVKKFVDEDKVFIIQINEEGQFFSKKDVNKLFKSSEEVNLIIKSFINDGNISYTEPKIVSIDNHPFLYTNFIFKNERLGIDLRLKTHLWLSILEDQLISFMGGGEYYNDYLKIVNSVVFLNQY